MSTKSSLAWFYTGIGVIGFAVGLTTGLSNSPVVAALLPLLFAMMGGIGGIELARADTTTSTGRERVQRFGRAAVTFGCSFLVALAFGMATRSPEGWGSIWPGKDKSAPQIAAHRDQFVADDIELLLLRRKLLGLGASVDEQSWILGSARDELIDGSVKTIQALLSLDQQLTKLVIDMKPIVDATDDVPIALYGTMSVLEGFPGTFKQIAAAAQAGWDVSSAVANNTEHLIVEISSIRSDGEIMDFLQRGGIDTKGIGRLAVAAAVLQGGSRQAAWSAGDQRDPQVLQLVGKSNSGSINSAPPRIFRGLASND